MTRAVAGALALTAALIPWQSTDPTPRFPDRSGTYLGEKPPGLKHELFAPGLVSTGGFERDAAATPDGREIFFGLAGPSYQYTTVVSTRLVDDRWSQPFKLGPAVNTKGSQEFSPYVSPDGKHFFFMSSRPSAPERLTFRLFRELHGRPGNGNADIYWANAGLITSLRAKADFGQRDTIHAAARAGDLAGVRALVEGDAKLALSRDEAGRTPLHAAAASGRPEVASFLISRGAEVNAADNNAWTSLHAAAAADQDELVRILIEGKAALESRTSEGETPLATAAGRGAARAAARLLQAGAATEAANAYGRTPLLLVARESGKADIARLLLDRKANVDAKDKFGDTPLTLAAWRGFRDVVDLLLQTGATVPATGPVSQSLLQSAAAKGLDALFMKLAGMGVDLTARTERGGTLLHDAAGGGSAAIVGELLARKFAVNDADRDGWTPLHNAAFMGRLDVVKALAAGGSDLNARNVLGQTAWNLARENGLADVADWLTSNGASQDAPRFPALTGDYLGQAPPGRTPKEFAPGIVGGHFSVHSSPAFSPDGREIYWAESIPPRGAGYGSGRTMMSRRAGDRWTYPARAMVGKVPLEDVPVITADGKHIYDMARRPIPGQAAGKENIWVADRVGDQWGDPRPLDAAVNALPHHWQFSVGPDGAMYFSSRWKETSGLFVSRLAGGRHAEPVALDAPVRATGREAMPFVSADGSYLLFQRNFDIHVSFRGPDGGWLAPTPLPPPVNTPEGELCPVVSPDGRYLFFMRSGHVYWVEAAVIEDLRPGPNR